MKTLATIAIGLLLAGCSDKLTRQTPLTSADAKPSDVTFLKLPDSATEIRYWDDGRELVAVFRISEPEFVALFPSAVFSEITDNALYPVVGFGDSSVPPWDGNSELATTTSGLTADWLEIGIGGEGMIYDRVENIGSYHKSIRSKEAW